MRHSSVLVEALAHSGGLEGIGSLLRGLLIGAAHATLRLFIRATILGVTRVHNRMDIRHASPVAARLKHACYYLPSQIAFSENFVLCVCQALSHAVSGVASSLQPTEALPSQLTVLPS